MICNMRPAVEARAFENDVHADLSPRKVSGVFLRINLNSFAADGDSTLFVGKI